MIPRYRFSLTYPLRAPSRGLGPDTTLGAGKSAGRSAVLVGLVKKTKKAALWFR